MTNRDAISNIAMIRVAYIEPVTKLQRKIIDDTFDMAIEALKQEPCDKYIKEIDHLRKYISKLETQIVEQQPCEDAISRQMALDLCERFGGCVPYSVLSSHDMLPSVSTEKTGRWIPRNSFLLKYRCSECKQESEKYNYCPNCGAKMEVENGGI